MTALLFFTACPLETKEDEDITYTVTADGSPAAGGTEAVTSTKLTFDFSEAVTGLAAVDITVTGSVTAGALSGSGKTRELALTGVSAGGTVTVKITKDGIESASKNVTVYKAASDPDTVATPVADPAGQSFTDSIDVTLSTTTAGAEIYYTLTSNEDPVQAETTDNFKYTTAITITDTVILRAKAFKEGLTPSGIVTQNYTKQTSSLDPVATPTVSPEPPLTFYEDTLTITLATTTADAAIHYTLDGSTPTAASQTYTAPFAIGTGVSVNTEITVKAIGIKEFMNNSEVLTVNYTKGDANNLFTKQPTFSVAAGAIDSGGTVTLTSEDGGAIYYTLDGSTPDAENGTGYTDPIAITENTLIKAIAVKAGWNASEVAEAKYLVRINAGGITWLDISEEIPNQHITSHAFLAKGDTKYVFVQGVSAAYSVKSWHSTDRLHWTEGGTVFSSGSTGSSGMGTGVGGVAWGDGRFVAVSGRNTAYSTDGENWTAVATVAGSGEVFTALTWGGPENGKIFVAGTSRGSIHWSSDGIAWTRLAHGEFDEDNMPGDPGASGLTWGSGVSQIIWEGEKFVAVANYGDMAYSSDGKTWTNVSPGWDEDDIFHSVIYTGTAYLVSGSYNQYSFSGDLTSHTTTSNDDGYVVQVYNNGTIFGIGNSGWTYSTDNAVSWTPFTLLTYSGGIYKIDGKLVAISRGICIQE
jgi:hypothetical protein